ncbi:MAG: aminotransferase class I/II-fold pyridoxal phosphate-dependent enzyme [Firmicutes bacterium]|nr:aminotransferase class I/II-fold pyridoxal phosphate-dependent enzyme [Bacillota bacterium]
MTDRPQPSFDPSASGAPRAAGYRLETWTVHAGRPGWPREGHSAAPPEAGQPTAPTIVPATAYWYPDAAALDRVIEDGTRGFSYSRYGTPTAAALEAALAGLEGTEAAIAYPSGMAAIHAALLGAGLRPGDRLLLSRDVYGATFTLARRLFVELGVQVELVDATDTAAARAALQRLRPRAFLFETISNPLLRVVDGPALVAAAHEAGALVIVDNTFATPLLARPAEWGADFVVHSTTKFLSGHGDVTGGVICTTAERRRALLELNKMVGAVPSPFDCWLTLRGLRTLAVRVERQTRTAAALAARLQAMPGVARVHYPGLPGHPDHERAARLLRAPGSMIALDLAGGRAAALALLERCRLWIPATTLGDSWSLILYPAMSSHRALTPEERAALGIGDGLVRLSVGLEDEEDLARDLERALGA